MELNAAVLSKRGRKVIEKEVRFEFEKVLQTVDSETVLSMINKTSTRFKVYEGRATASKSLGWQPYDTSIATCYHLVQSVVEDFWKRWTELYAPALVL